MGSATTGLWGTTSNFGQNIKTVSLGGRTN